MGRCELSFSALALMTDAQYRFCRDGVGEGRFPVWRAPTPHPKQFLLVSVDLSGERIYPCLDVQHLFRTSRYCRKGYVWGQALRQQKA